MSGGTSPVAAKKALKKIQAPARVAGVSTTNKRKPNTVELMKKLREFNWDFEAMKRV